MDSEESDWELSELSEDGNDNDELDLLNHAYGHTENIDSGAFYAKDHLTFMLREQPLDSLLEQNQHLVHEIKEYKGDMQNLVYENYNKFIDATETIREMKSTIDTMDSKMETLTATMENICCVTDDVNRNLSKNKEKIAKLLDVKGMLQKLEYIFQLPEHLERSIQLGAYDQAIRNYQHVMMVLQKHTHINSFKVIGDRADSIMKVFTDKLQKELCEGSVPQTEVGSHLRFLLAIGTMPARELLDYYFASQRLSLKSIINAHSSLQPDDFEIRNHINRLCMDFVATFLNMCGTFEELFVCNASLDNEMIHNELVKFAEEEFKHVFTVCKAVLSEDHYSANSFIEKGRIDRNLADTDLVPEENSEAVIPGSSIDDGSELVSLMTKTESIQVESPVIFEALHDFQHQIQQAHVLVRPAQLQDRASEVIEFSLRSQLSSLFKSLRSQLRNVLVAHAQRHKARCHFGIITHFQDDNDLNVQAVMALHNDIRNTLCNGLYFLHPLFSTAQELVPDLGVGMMLVGVARAELQAIYRWIVRFCLSICGEMGAFDHGPLINTHLTEYDLDVIRSMSTLNPLMTICFAQVSFLLESSVTMIFSHAEFNESFSEPEDHKFEAECQASLQFCSSRLLYRFVQQQCQLFLELLRPTKWNWATLSDHVSNSVSDVAKGLETLLNRLENILDQERKKQRRRMSSMFRRRTNSDMSASFGNASALPSSRHRGLAKDIELLFRSKLVLVPDLALKPMPLVQAITNCVLKTLVERVRCLSFSRFQLQQLQLDVSFLRNVLPTFMTPTPTTHSLLDEVLASGCDRCSDNVEGLNKDEFQKLLKKVLTGTLNLL